MALLKRIRLPLKSFRASLFSTVGNGNQPKVINVNGNGKIDEPGKVLIPEMGEEYIRETYEEYSSKIVEAVSMHRHFGHQQPKIMLSRGDFAAWRKCFSDNDFQWIFPEISRHGISFTYETHPVLQYVPLLVGWDPPSDDWLMMNVDAARRREFERSEVDDISFNTACVARYRDGKAIHASGGDPMFFDNNHLAEYSAIYNGLLMGRKLGARDIILPCDSKTVVDELNANDRANVLENRTLDTAHAINKFLIQEKIWNELEKYTRVKIIHVYREQNKYADYVASNWRTDNYKSKDYLMTTRAIEEADQEGRKYLRLGEIKKKQKKNKKKDGKGTTN